MKRLLFFLLILLFASSFGLPQTPPGAWRGTPPPRPMGSGLSGIERLFDKGFILDDTNGDGFFDAVVRAISLPPAPAPAEVAAAAEIAARFAHETMALDLGIVVAGGAAAKPDSPEPIGRGGGAPRYRPVGILVGTRHPEATLTGGLPSLLPGQGLIALSGDRFLVTGADDAGVRRAGLYVASRAPSIWATDGTTWQNLLADLSAEAHITSIVVDAEDRGLASMDVAVTLADRSDAAKIEAKRDRLRYPDLAELRIELKTGSVTRTLRIAGEPLKAAPRPSPSAPGEPKVFGLAELYTPNGLFSDADKDFIPDSTDTTLVLGAGATASGSADFAARLGLDSTGIRLPLMRLDTEVDDVKKLRNPVVLGRGNRLAPTTKDELAPRAGVIRVVPKAFGNQTAVFMAGADEAGFSAIADHVSRRFPYVWERGKGSPELKDVEEDARRFFAGRSAAGQAASAVYRLRRLAKKLEGKELESVEARVVTEGAPEGFESFLDAELRAVLRPARLSVEAASLDVRRGPVVLDETWDLRWEVDDFWSAFRSKVLPKVKRGKGFEIEVRVSESPDMRKRLEDEIRAEIARKGADAKVHVLSAYKQGYSWLVDEVLPDVKGKNVGSIEIRFATIERYPQQIRWQRIESPIRWLQELYPVDEVLARELGIPADKIKFERSFEDKPIYRVSVKDTSGKEIYTASFDPAFVVAPFFATFPDYEKVRVTTGWLRARVDGTTVADERIVTDPERFWERYQKDVLGRLHDYTLDLYEGKLEARHAPYFGELRVDVEMSEPDYRVGIDEEQVSSLEALHEDIFFETVAFFDVLGDRYASEALTYPGRVIPVIHPSREGKGGTAKVHLTGKPAGYPRVEISWQERGGRPEKKREEVARVEVEDPKVEAASVRAGGAALDWLEIRVPVDMAEDRRDDLVSRERAEVVDRLILSSEQARGMVDALSRMHGAGLFQESLSYAHVGEIRLRFATDPGAETPGRVVALAGTGRSLLRPDVKALAGGYQYSEERIVSWREPISPDESERIVQKLSTFPEVTAYWCGKSYLGRNIWAMDLMLPMKSELWSQAKASTLKPVVIYSARQHANEVSSTSHVLRFAELLVTDPAYRKYLEKVNVVIHPITNPDGAALAYELYKTTPRFMLHAGYLGALGVDVTAQQWSRDPIYPESAVRRELWQTWLPDVFLNPHGYPSHEWVQLFGGYSAWVRSRDPQGRDWWSARGWFVPGFGYVQDPKFPKHKEVALALKDKIAERISGVPELRAMNERMAVRYMKYGGWDPEVYRLDLHKGTLIYTPVKGAKQNPQSSSFQVRHPNVTVVELVQESPDETASGDWLELVARAGLEFDRANLEFLYDSVYEVKRERKVEGGAVLLRVSRKRPVLPKGSKWEPETP